MSGRSTSSTIASAPTASATIATAAGRDPPSTAPTAITAIATAITASAYPWCGPVANEPPSGTAVTTRTS